MFEAKRKTLVFTKPWNGRLFQKSSIMLRTFDIAFWVCYFINPSVAVPRNALQMCQTNLPVPCTAMNIYIDGEIWPFTSYKY